MRKGSLHRIAPRGNTAGTVIQRSGSRKLVGLVAYDGVAPLDLVGPLEAFTKARQGEGIGTSCYEVITLGLSGKRVTSESGLVLAAQYTLANAPELDTIVVPGGSGLRGETKEIIAAWLAQRFEKTRRIVSVSGGIYAIAATGFLAGRTVTTHWRFARDVARQFPTLRVNPSASFMKDGDFYSSAGGTAAVELTLSLIEEDYGRPIALAVAKELVARLRPAGDADSAFESHDYEPEPGDRLSELPGWIAAHLRENLGIEVLAQRCCVCPRHFARLFKTLFGRTPADFVEDGRLSEARHRLTNSRASIESIGLSVGYKSADAFRRAFERRLGVAPRDFRKGVQLVISGKDRGRRLSGPPMNAARRFTAARASRLATAA
jgi:transcriptional regulator GlxA family with amidase domain